MCCKHGSRRAPLAGAKPLERKRGKTYPESRQILVERVRALTNNDTAEALKASLGDSLSDWAIEFHIIDAPRPDGSFTIPFFSRITLRDEARTLKGMAFEVVLRFIPT
jgi:uncharacterized protein (TIGR04141 family)